MLDLKEGGECLPEISQEHQTASVEVAGKKLEEGFNIKDYAIIFIVVCRI